MSNTVLCMKWGQKYGPEYVNRLYSMVSRNLTLPFRFVCLTDNSEGLADGIETLPLPSLNIDTQGPERGWNKIATFVKPLHDITGNVLFLDLDVVIVDNIDCFFQAEGEFLIIRDFIRRDGTGNSSVYRFEANAFPDILQYFRENFSKMRQVHRNEQEFLSHYMMEHHSIGYWPKEWCRSFKKDCVQKGIRQFFKVPEIPAGAKIIIFHGLPNPPEAIRGISGKWYRKVLPTPWIEKYWH